MKLTFGHLLLLFFLQFTDYTAISGPVRISFLNQTEALNQTTAFLSTNGCNQEAVRLFENVVRWNNISPLGFDTTRFPPCENGFYTFQSISNLLESLPQPILTANHPPQMNCYDAVILLVGNSMKTSLQPDVLGGPFLTPITWSNIDTMAVEETPRDAFNCYPPWYIQATKRAFSESMQNNRMCLSAVLNSYCILPHSAKRDDSGQTLFKALKSTWKQRGVVFPANSEVVICHSVVLAPSGPTFVAPFANTTHAGLLFKDHSKLIYLEKAGVFGPYVRLDLTGRKDLLPWLNFVVAPSTDARDMLFVTFNDVEMEPLSPITH